jgi:hypothetical protein
MVPRDRFVEWLDTAGVGPGTPEESDEVQRVLDGVEAISGVRASRSHRAPCGERCAEIDRC